MHSFYLISALTSTLVSIHSTQTLLTTISSIPSLITPASTTDGITNSIHTLARLLAIQPPSSSRTISIAIVTIETGFTLARSIDRIAHTVCFVASASILTIITKLSTHACCKTKNFRKRLKTLRMSESLDNVMQPSRKHDFYLKLHVPNKMIISSQRQVCH